MQNDFGDTALVAAVGQGHLYVAEILVKNEADVNYRNKVRVLIPATQVCIMWPMIRHGIMVNQWDVQGMGNKHAACAVHSRRAYVVIPPFDVNTVKSRDYIAGPPSPPVHASIEQKWGGGLYMGS